jgi:hypothetical protein
MPVRKTESRIPANFQASDLGQAVVAADRRCALVSFVTSPTVVGRENTYILFVTDPALAGTAHAFEWSFGVGDLAADVQNTTFGEITYQPADTGPLTVTVRALDAANAEQAKLTLTQEVVSPSMELEAMIGEAIEQPGPGAADPIALRELVNEHCAHYQSTTLSAPEAGDAFAQFLFRLALDGVSRRPSLRRKQQLRQLAAAINGSDVDFSAAIAEGFGVCNIRLPLLAMMAPASGGSPILSWTELPEARDQRGFAEEQLRTKLASTSETSRIDLFNLVRFPKSNISQCGRILETLRNRYFSGASFQDVLEGMSGTRAHWITRHYLEGPLARS